MNRSYASVARIDLIILPDREISQAAISKLLVAPVTCRKLAGLAAATSAAGIAIEEVAALGFRALTRVLILAPGNHLDAACCEKR